MSEQLGNFIDKDGAEAINSTIVWIEFLNNFLKGIINAYGCDFELLVNVDKNNPIDSETLNREEVRKEKHTALIIYLLRKICTSMKD